MGFMKLIKSFSFSSRSIIDILLSMKTEEEPTDEKSSRDVETLWNSV
jgi:hypothetical protein